MEPKFKIGDRVVNFGPSGRNPLRGSVSFVAYNEAFREFQYDLTLTCGSPSTAWEHELRRAA